MPMALRLFTALIIGNPAKSAIAWRNLIRFRVLNFVSRFRGWFDQPLEGQIPTNAPAMPQCRFHLQMR